MRSRCWAVLSVASIIVATPAVASTPGPDPVWARTAGRGLDAVTVTPDGSVYVTGYRSEGRDWTDTTAVLRKFGPAGRALWTRAWDPPHAWARGIDTVALPDGSVVLAGAMGRDGFEGGAWFLRRYSADGVLLWQRTTPEWRSGTAEGISDIAAGGGLIVAVGSDFGCCGDPSRDGWARAYGSDGRLRWISSFEVPGVPDRYFDDASAVTVSTIGRTYIGGWAELEGHATEARVRSQVIVQKLGPTGSPIWTWRGRVRDPRTTAPGTTVTGIAARGDRLLVVGRFGRPVRATSRSPGRAWILRIGFDGHLLWRRLWGQEPSAPAQPSEVSVGDDGRAYVSGWQRDELDERIEAFLRVYGGAGRPLWFATFAEEDDRSTLGTHVAVSASRLFLTSSALGGPSDEMPTGGTIWAYEL